MSGLPSSWIPCCLDDLFQEIKNGTTQKQNKDGIGYPVSRIETIQKGRFDLSRIQHIAEVPLDFVSINKYEVGDIAFSHINSLEHVGKTALYEGAPENFIHGMNLLKLRPRSPVLPKFLYYQLNTRKVREAVRERVGHAVNQVSINQTNLRQVPMALAPLNEQKRIVAKLDELLPKLEACKQRLEKIPTILKHFRQSVLGAAISGRLTEQWRRKNKVGESASELLLRIKAEVPDDHLAIFEDSQNYDLPEGWAYAKFGSLGKLVSGGTPSRENADYWNGGYPWVSPKDMKSFRIHSSIETISELALKEAKVKRIPKGATLLVVRGMILNHTLPVAILDRDVAINQDIKALIPHLEEMSEYVSLAMLALAPRILFEVKEATHGTRRIETEVLVNYAVPIPPLDEQKEIVRLTNLLFAEMETIKQRHLKSSQYVNKVGDSLLVRAFSGGLATQDASDEPASLLLERIKSAVAPKAKKSAPRKRKSEKEEQSASA